MENRRHFTRILFSTDANLIVDDVGYTVSIHDISLNGALVSKPSTKTSLKQKLGVLSFSLNDQQISMHIAVVHEENEEIGLQCNAIDIDSITMLRRLIELNLGDDSQLHSELNQLSRHH